MHGTVLVDLWQLLHKQVCVPVQISIDFLPNLADLQVRVEAGCASEALEDFWTIDRSPSSLKTLRDELACLQDQHFEHEHIQTISKDSIKPTGVHITQ